MGLSPQLTKTARKAAVCEPIHPGTMHSWIRSEEPTEMSAREAPTIRTPPAATEVLLLRTEGKCDPNSEASVT